MKLLGKTNIYDVGNEMEQNLEEARDYLVDKFHDEHIKEFGDLGDETDKIMNKELEPTEKQSERRGKEILK